ncbi:MAG: YdcF family protein [Flavobacteriales bacterium]|nr:YdcF family protein [Flavobacteriales bacterium]
MRAPTLKDLLHWNIIVAVILGGTLLTNEFLIERRVSASLFADAHELPYNRVALVLGTLPVARDGSPNPFFRERMQAAADLYCSGKVQHLILSGDKDIWGHNEPEEMRRALLALGVHRLDMTLDHDGINTFESVVRTKKVFGQDRITIVSQAYHNVRALFIAREAGLNAVAFNADAPPALHAKRTWFRERASRVKMWMHLLG